MAWPPPPAQALPLPALHACLTFAHRSPAMQTAMRGSAAPQHQLREEGAAAGGGLVEAEPGVEQGPGRRGQGGGGRREGCGERRFWFRILTIL